MFERLTDRAKKIMALANQEAQRFNHEYLGTEHILLGLVKEGSCVGAQVLKNLKIDLRQVRTKVEELIKKGPEMAVMGNLPKTPRAKKVIEYAIEEARNLKHGWVGSEHLLLGLLREQDGVAAQVLIALGLNLEKVRKEVLRTVDPKDESDAVQTPPAPTETEIEEKLLALVVVLAQKVRIGDLRYTIRRPDFAPIKERVIEAIRSSIE